MSSNFLQRFKGKTAQIGKDGLIDVVRQAGGSTSGNVVVQTNINFKPKPVVANDAPKMQRHSSSDVRVEQDNPKEKVEPVRKPPAPLHKGVKQQSNSKPIEQPNTQQPQSSPFYVANPFRMDDDEPVEEFKPQPKKVNATPPPYKATSMEKVDQKQPASMKQTVNSISTRAQSYDNKKGTNREWVKLGGLGANIGGQDWQEKKKKLDKMQEFAEQVKAANIEKMKERKPADLEEEERKQKREKNAREKALEYCKNIPKPPKKAPRKEEELPEEPQKPEAPLPSQLSELEMYQRRHQQLQRLLNKN